MAVSNRRYVRVPPDSTGKRVGNRFVLHLEYTSRIATVSLGDTIRGNTSLVEGEVIEVIEVTGQTQGTFVLNMRDDDFDSSYTDGEVLSVDGTPVATANGTGTPIFYSEIVLVGGSNPSHRQIVDVYGSAKMSFDEGAPQFNSFGELVAQGNKSIVDYTHVGKTTPNMYLMSGSGGFSTYSLTDSLETLTVTAASGSYTTYRSNVWHKYQAGAPITMLMTLVTEEQGKDGLVRRWGYFDDNDGLFFEQSGSELYVVERSSVGGTVTETKVSQSAWNGDQLDGDQGINNVSTRTLDPSKANIYFIDLQWLGAGRTRFGIVAEDRRIVAHTFQNAGKNVVPYMAKASLPITFEQVNYEATAGSSDMKVICASIQSNETYDPQVDHYAGDFSDLSYTASVDSFTPVFSIRPAITKSNGQDNRNYSKAHTATIYSPHHPMVVGVFKGGTLTGADWTPPPEPIGDSQIDILATEISGARALEKIIVPQGSLVKTDFTDSFDDVENWVKRWADIDMDPEPVTVAVKLLPNATFNTGSEATGSMSITFDFDTYVD